MSAPKFIEVSELANYEVSDDGSVRLHLVDAEGCEASVAIPLARLQELALTMPKIIAEALTAAYGTPAMRLVHNVVTWKMEDGDEGKVILTFSTSDHFQVSFAVRGNQVHKMAELIVEHEFEAYPQGLRFH